MATIYDKKQIIKTKDEEYAEWILERCRIKDANAGGIFSIITGSQGEAKTSILLGLCDETMKNYPQDKCFWYQPMNSPFQFTRLEGKWNIMIENGSGITINDRNNKGHDITQSIDVTWFDNFEQLWQRAKRGYCNVVFFKDNIQGWSELFHYIRSVNEWVHVFIDEISEIAPFGLSGKNWTKVQNLSNDLKEIRKCFMYVHSTTQSISDIDWRIVSKIMLKVFLPGAKAYSSGRVIQLAIDNLNSDHINGSTAYLEYSGKFGKVTFNKIYLPSKECWEVRKI